MITIGDFFKLSRVSVRMLRHYEQLGLLTPSQRDPFREYLDMLEIYVAQP